MMEETDRLIKFLYNEDSEVVAEETGNGTITRYIRGLGIISSDSVNILDRLSCVSAIKRTKLWFSIVLRRVSRTELGVLAYSG